MFGMNEFGFVIVVIIFISFHYFIFVFLFYQWIGITNRGLQKLPLLKRFSKYSWDQGHIQVP